MCLIKLKLGEMMNRLQEKEKENLKYRIDINNNIAKKREIYRLVEGRKREIQMQQRDASLFDMLSISRWR